MLQLQTLNDIFFTIADRRRDRAMLSCLLYTSDLIGEQVGVDGNVDSADGEAGEVGDGPLPAILGEDGDAIAFADAPGLERDVYKRQGFA